MKKIALISALAIGGLFYNTADAQIRVSLGLHLPGIHVIAQTPVYANYSNSDDYYYLPDVDAYYSVAEQCYYYNDGYNWISAAYLPGAYRNYDWRTARRYEVREHTPFLRADFYREKYRGNIGNWSRSDNHYDNRSYANRSDDRLRFEKRDEQHFDNNRDNRSGNDRGNDQRFDNRGQNNYNQPSRQQGNYNQPAQNNDRGQGQPQRQNGNGQRDNNNASGQHFTDNHDRSGHDRFRS